MASSNRLEYTLGGKINNVRIPSLSEEIHRLRCRECVLMCACVQLLPLQIEAEAARAGLNLVLGLEVVHAVCGNAVNGQDDVSNTYLGFGCFASISELKRHPIKYY